MNRPWDGRVRRIVKKRKLTPAGIVASLECGHVKSLVRGGDSGGAYEWAICDDCPAPRRLHG